MTGSYWLLVATLGLSTPARAQDEAAPAPEDAAPENAAPEDAAPEDAADAWYAGLPVSQVSLEAPDGGLPRENLEPLLRVSQGDRYDPDLIRQDIALLMRAGAFAAVEVDAEPWLEIDANGEPAPAVRLIYRVYPPTRIDRIVVEGARGPARRTVQAAHGLGREQPFFPRRDGPAAERRITEVLQAEGWPQATASVTPERMEENRVLVRVAVDPGRPRLLEDVVMAATLPLDARDLKRRLRKVGLKPGQRITDDAARRGRDVVRARLVAEGYLDPRVSLLFSEAADGKEVLAVLGEPGARTEIVATGAGAPTAARLHEIIGVQPGTRLSTGTVEDAAAALRKWFQRRGWYQAQVTPRLDMAGDDALLVLAVDRGLKHKVRHYSVQGAEVLGEDTVAAALRAGAPGSLGNKVLVDGELSAATRAVEEVYRGRGHLDAQVSITDITPGPARWRPPLSRVVPVTLSVVVEEGAGSQLSELLLTGDGAARPEVKERVHEARTALVGASWRPTQLDAVRDELVEDLRSQGYLGADAVVRTQREGTAVRAELVVEAGQQARLRSVVIQGNQRTRRSVIAREVGLELGQPISPEALEQTRRRLYDLDLFRVVTLELVGEDDRARDLIVRVDERPPVLVEVAGGVASDRGVAARGRLAHRNLFGLGHRASLLTQAGYAWLGESWQIDTLTPVWRAAIRYEAPNVPARGQRLVAEVVLNELVQEPTFRTSDIGASLGVRVRLLDDGEAFLSWGARIRTLEDVDPGALVAGDPWLDVLGLTEPPLTELDLREARRVITGPSLAVVLDRRDDPLDPRQGWRATGLLDISDGLIEEPASVRGEARFDELVPLGRVVLALTANGGVGWAGAGQNTLAVEDRLYLGGSSSLRGFRPGTVGPANHVPRPDINYPSAIEPFVRNTALADEPNHWVPTGGDLLTAGAVELRVPFSVLGLGDFDDVWLVGFVDIGRVSFINSDIAPTSQVDGLDPLVRVGTGGGLRLSTAIGPVSLLLGANPAPLVERDESELVVHFTLGDL